MGFFKESLNNTNQIGVWEMYVLIIQGSYICVYIYTYNFFSWKIHLKENQLVDFMHLFSICKWRSTKFLFYDPTLIILRNITHIVQSVSATMQMINRLTSDCL